MNRLQGKRAIVTGAASGIGRSIARRLVSEGALLIAADIDVSGARRLAAELGDGVIAAEVDVSCPTDMERVVGVAVERLGGLDVLVNNAGTGLAASAPDTQEADWDRVLSINLKGTFYGIKYGVPAMRASGGGSIINMASIVALVGTPERAAYSAAKGGIMALTRATAIDHIGEGIRINCIAPGTVDTPWINRIIAGVPDPEKARRDFQARQLHGRFVAPEEIAAMAAYLASDESASIIGAVMVVDGGITAR